MGLFIWLFLPPSLSPSLSSSLSLFLISCVLYIIRVGKGDSKGEGIYKIKVGERLRRWLRGQFKEAVQRGSQVTVKGAVQGGPLRR